MTFQRVGVIGGGQMGAGIAEVCIRSGVETVIIETDADAVTAAHRRIDASLARALKSAKIDDAARDRALALLTISDDYGVLADRDLVVEAIVENEAAKTAVFSKIDTIVADPSAVLASNTSSIPLTRIARATTRPGQVVGMHFFNPVPVLALIEIVSGLLTSPATVERCVAFAEGVLSKKVVRSKDQAGFVVNALLVPFLLSAIRMFESGFATADDIDTGLVEGCAHPMGPLHLCDLIGLDTMKSVADSLYEEFKEPTYAPPALLLRMVEAGMLGRKSGRGFFDYAK